MEDDAIAIARFTNLHLEDEGAHDALRQAAIDAGEPQPQGLLDSMAANWLEAQGQFWSTTAAGQHRLRIAKSELARKGAEAYVFGSSGNAYTQHLRNRFGPYQRAGGRSSSVPSYNAAQGSAPSGKGFFAEAFKVARDFWSWYRSQHEAVQVIIAVQFAGWIVLGFVRNPETRNNPFEWLVLALGAGAVTALCSLALVFLVGVGARAREWYKDPVQFKAGLWSCLKVGAVCLAIGAGGGLLWGLVATLGNREDSKPIYLYMLVGSCIVLWFPVWFGGATYFGGAGFKWLDSLKPTDKKSAAPTAGSAPLSNTAVDSSPTTNGISSAPQAFVPTGSPTPAAPSSAAAVLPWTAGCLTGDRMGAKTFRAGIPTELAPLDVLAQASRLLMQLHYVQPWRVNGQVRSHASDNGVSITATTSYEWDNSPYYAEENGKVVLIQSITGQTKRGSGPLHLECTIFGNEEGDQVVVQIEFSEPTYPMWLKRQSEGAVALTLVDLGQELATVLNADITWEFVKGDWTTFQIMGTPAGSLTIRRARGN